MAQDNPPQTHADRLAELDRRHDDLIARLGDLNEQIERALARVAPPDASASAPGARTC